MAAKLNNIRRQVAEHTANVRCSRKPTPPVTKDSFPPEPHTALTDTQKKLHGAVLAAPEGIQLGQIEQQLPELGRSELYYRLECLVLLGYLAKTQNNENTIGIPRVTYRAKAAARVA